MIPNQKSPTDQKFKYLLILFDIQYTKPLYLIRNHIENY